MPASTDRVVRRTPPRLLFPLALALAAALPAAGAAQAAQAAPAADIDIAWSANGSFERAVDVAPGKFAEFCGKLARGTVVTWSYQAAAPLNFNIHYHEAKAVIFPVQKDATAQADGKLPISMAQDYCWMWTNKGTAPVALKVKLAR